MRSHKLHPEDVIEVYQDKHSWSLILWLCLLKSLLFVVVFTVAATYLFEGFWMWIAIGGVLLIVIPIYNMLQLQKQKNEFDKLANLTGIFPDELGEQFLKGMLQAALDEEQAEYTCLPLNKNNKEEIIRSLKITNVIPDSVKPEINEAYDVLKLLRTHADTRIFNFDTECIDEEESYTHLVAEHLSITAGQIEISDLSSFFDFEKKQVTIKFRFDNQQIYWAFEQSSDWVCNDFFINIFSFVREQSDGELLLFPPEDQCSEVIFLPKAATKTIKQCGILRDTYS